MEAGSRADGEHIASPLVEPLDLPLPVFYNCQLIVLGKKQSLKKHTIISHSTLEGISDCR